jgi:hypothetical protein
MFLRRLTLVFVAALLAGCGGSKATDGVTPAATLMRTEDAGSACPTGGTLVRSGPDANGNDRLDDEEITQSTLVCTPASTPIRVETSTVEPGPRCAAGGTRARSGIDANANGTLEDSEVESDEVVCAAPHAVVSVVEAVAPGSTCRYGGHLVRSGLDGNDDGTLTAEETTARSTVCDHPVLSRTMAKTDTEACAAGGVEVAQGTDRNDDGKLSDDEVTQATMVCGTAVEGDLRLSTPADLERAKGVVAITGSLVIDGSAIEEALLPDLRVVAGTLSLGYGAAVSRITLPKVQSIGTIDLSSNAVLEELHLPALWGVHRAKLRDLSNFSTLELPALTSVETSLELTTLPKMGNLSLPALYQVGVLWLDGIASTSVESDLQYADLVYVSLPALETLRLDLLASCRDFDLRKTGLTTFSLPRLRTARGVSVRGTGTLASVSLPLLEEIGTLDLEDNAALEGVAMPQLAAATYVSLSGNRKLASLAGLAALRTCTSFRFEGKTALTDLHELALNTVGSLVVAGTSLRRVDLRSLWTANAIRIGEWQENPVLETIELPQLSSATTFAITDAPSLTALRAPDLDLVAERLTVSRAPALPTCDVTRLRAQLRAAPRSVDATGTDDKASCSASAP